MATETTIPISVVTTHGRHRLDGRSDERLIDVLIRHNVPWSAISAYAIHPGDEGRALYPALDKQLSEFVGASEILLYFNRNVNPFLFNISGFQTIGSDDSDVQGTEYIYQKLDNESGKADSFLKKLSPEECKNIIADRVLETVEAHLPTTADLVVGVSGGGDSNAMLYGLSRLAEKGLKIHPVIIKGIPDWDQGVPRAQFLCDSYGLKLTVIEEPEVRALLGIESGDVALIDRFENEFQGDDFEFMGTLLIRLALGRFAAQLNTPYIATGLNLEDVLCEALFRVSTGLKPSSFPLRKIGDVSLLMPLWQCPKRIIDGCFPKFSLDNYEARYPCFSLGRNLYYSVVYAIQSQFPGFADQLARGLSELGATDPVEYKLDDQLGFHVERFVPFPLRQKFQRMLGTAATA